MLKYLHRLLPERMRPRHSLTPEKRLELFSTVTDHDPCLVAVMDGLTQSLEIEFQTAITVTTDVEKLRAVERMRAVYSMLHNIESEREQAKALRAARETQK